MTKLKRSAKAFARRVKIGDEGIWLVVEGRDHDRVHYSRLLKHIERTRDLRVSIRLAEQIHVDGVAAGGKKHVIKIYNEFAAKGRLVQHGEHGSVVTLFMLDRDRDDYEGIAIDSPQVVYTYNNDVESDVLRAADIWRAAESAYGIDGEMLRKLRLKYPDPAAHLFGLWRTWTHLGLLALACGQHGCAPWGIASNVNAGRYGMVDEAEIASIESLIQTNAGEDMFTSQVDRADRHLESLGARLLKGRLIAGFVHHLVQTKLAKHILRAGVKPTLIVDTAIETIEYSGSWFEAYEQALDRALAAASFSSSRGQMALAL